MSEPVTRVSLFDGFEDFLACKGGSFGALIDEAGLSRELFQDTNNEISLNAAADLLTRASVQTGDLCLRLHWAESYPEGAAGVIGFLAMNAKSLRAALKVLARYVSVCRSG